MQKNLLFAGIALLAVLLGWMLLVWQPTSEHNKIPVLAEAPRGGDFTLRGPQGSVSLKDYRGQVVLIYFGYTWCPDICPTNLALFSRVLNELTPEELTRVQPIFISVDPARDTIERLKEYTEYFHEKLIGVTGTPSAVEDVAASYGVAFRAVNPDTESNYAVDHSADTYLVDPEGKLVLRLPHGTTAETLLVRIREQFSGEAQDKAG
ncbi:MAG: SCO family protein [Candidatus Thiodiazotropha sp. (ex Myrtea sp. 'scaly one' KF741663)]|nr:SCO family protein [Candidatus Thiodiazotropha sp. (ex Myrtea sp. 'scaly one' KF741663)]